MTYRPPAHRARASKRRLLVLALAVSASACATRTRTVVSSGAPSSSARARDGEQAAPPAPFSPTERERITRVQPWVMQAAAKRDLDPDLVNGVIWVESRFDPRARSSAGARGLMQLMPATASALARDLGWSRPRSYDPEFNVTAGTHYLAKLIARYDGDEALGLAAYNAGAGNVDKWLRDDGELPPVSRRYVELVMDARARFRAVHEGPTPRTDTMLAQGTPPPEEPAPSDAATRRVVETAPLVPEPPPSGEASEPPPFVPEVPVRYDLDRVESTYVPEPPPEPPLVDTPWPPIDPATSPESVEPAEPPSPAADRSAPPAGEPGPRGLPSVLD